MAQLFIVFCSFFWGIFINMVITVSTVDKKIMESAKTLNTKTLSMFFSILFPYSLPSLLNRLNFQLSSGFMVLTAAELIGATSGLGWFIQYYSTFADYTRVIAGIIMIGVVITVTNKAMTDLQKLLIKWK
jgi:NitT/TauT family transport system permease protein